MASDQASANRKLAQRTVLAPNSDPIAIAGKEHVPALVGGRHEITYTVIETRGAGGLFLCDPTPGYQVEQGSLTNIPVLSPAERTGLIEAACALNETLPPVTQPPSAGVSGRPGDDYNEKGDFREVLRRHSWELARAGENEYWRRPGKQQGYSASLRDRVFYVFSSNAAPFEMDTAYAPFSVFTLLEHGGNFAAAASALRSQGFGGNGSSSDADVDLSAICQFGTGDTTADGRPTALDLGPVPEELLCVPGFISQVMDECLETAPYPNPVMAFGGALALQSFLGGRKVRDPGDNRTNLYLLGLAYSSAGKDWPRKINMRILHEIGQVDCVGERFASGEGLQDSLFLQPTMLFQTDEIDSMLQAINKSHDVRYENIMSTLLTLYTSANSVYPMRRKAGKEPAGVIDQPCLTIFGTAIPNHYYGALSERMLTNGFFARMLILECGQRGRGQEPKIRGLPDLLLDTASYWASFPTDGGDLAAVHPVPAVVPQSHEAQNILIEARKDAEAEYAKAENAQDVVGTTVWGRVSEQARKLALLYAISENHRSPEIGKAAANWAVRFVMHQARRMLFMARTHVTDSPFDAECLKLLQKLRDAPGRTLSHSVLLKRMKTDARRFQEIIQTLEQRRDLEIVTNPTTGRPSREYRLLEGVK